jgi:uncharacterized protein
MIIETIFSTLDEDGKPHFAPMGILWGEKFVTVRPFRDTHTCSNLLSSGYGVANLTHDVLAFVQCGLYKTVLPFFSAKVVPGVVFQETCSWLEMEVVAHGGSDERAELRCRVLHKDRQKDFMGFCRASNAIIEATIMATRLAFIDPKTAIEKLDYYGEIVEKTGGETENKAFQLVQEYIRKREE